MLEQPRETGLGIDVAEAARPVRPRGRRPIGGRPSSEALRLSGWRKPVAVPGPDDAGGFDVEGTVRALFHNTYNRRDLSTIDRICAENVHR